MKEKTWDTLQDMLDYNIKRLEKVKNNAGEWEVKKVITAIRLTVTDLNNLTNFLEKEER